MRLPSHYETGYSLAVDGKITADEVTIFRFSENLDRVFVTGGKTVSRPRMADACRTQVEIEVGAGSLQLLRDKPLGNHLLLLPGNYSELLLLACRYKGIEVIA